MVCDVAGPREPSHLCRSEAQCPSFSDVQKEPEDSPTAKPGPTEQDTTSESSPAETNTSVPPTATSGPKPGKAPGC